MLIYLYHSSPVDIAALCILRLAITPAFERLCQCAVQTLLLVARGCSSGMGKRRGDLQLSNVMGNKRMKFVFGEKRGSSDTFLFELILMR